ncbi:large polymerase protein [Agrotis ipsilon virus]|nr:large polymerase protein [Agrotis ipsilon virus]
MNEFNLDTSDDEAKVGPPPLPTHLDTPITTKNQELATGQTPPNRSKRGQKTLEAELQLLMQDAHIDKPPERWDPSQAHKHILRSDLTSAEHYADKRLRLFLKRASRTTRLQFKGLGCTRQDYLTFDIDKIDPNKITILKKMNRLREGIESLVRLSGIPEYKRSQESKLYPWTEVTDSGIISLSLTGNIKIWMLSGIALLKVGLVFYLLNRDQILQLSDIVSQRCSIYLSSCVGEHLNNDCYLSSDQVLSIFCWGDSILEEFGNEGFDLVYKWEAICTGVLLERDKHMISEFLNNLIRSVNEKNPNFTLYMMKAIRTLREWANNNLHHVSQAYGLYRIWGHPIINPTKGIIALQELAKKYRHGETQTLDEIDGVFNETFINRYWKAKGVWPEVDLTDLGPHHPISKSYNSGGPPPELPNKYKAHWALVKMKRTFPIDPKFDIVELLSDKAMSLGMRELIRSIKQHYSIGEAKARSVLVQWLKSDLSDPVVFLNRIDREGFLPDESVVGTCPKEREGKINARLFGLLTLEKRMYVVLTEALIAEHILPFFREITMIDDAVTLAKRQVAFTSTKSRKGSSDTTGGTHLVRISSLDFQKWNTNMRKLETLRIFQNLDNLFGLTNCISRTHEMFETAIMYLADSYFLPPIDNNSRIRECPEVWTGHLGGIEGLRQKGWTLWTVSLILLAARDVVGEFKLMGQGDNQILKITYPPHMTDAEINDSHRTFLLKLDRILAKVGPPLKLEETWTSSSLFIYGKFLIWDGLPLSMSLKKIARMFRLSNDMYPTIESSLSSLAANCIAAAGSDTDPFVSFFVYQFELIGCLYFGLHSTYLHEQSIHSTIAEKGISYHLPLSPTDPQSVFKRTNPIRASRIINIQILDDLKHFSLNLYNRICLTPRNLGGFPILLLPQLFLRQFPDMETLVISFLKKVWEIADASIKKIIETILSPDLNPTRNYELLFENPHCINLATPSSPSESKRNQILKYLNGEASKPDTWIRNEEFKEFLIASSLKLTSLQQLLITMDPPHPRIMSEVWASTPTARARSGIGKLGKSNTIIRLATDAQYDIGKRISQSEVQSVVASFYMMYSHNSNLSWAPDLCSVDWASKLRDDGWGLGHLEGLSTSSPLEIFELHPTGPTGECDPSHNLNVSPDYILIRVDQTLAASEFQSPSKTGGFRHYSGIATKEKFKGYGKDLARINASLLARVMGLTKLIHWVTNLGSNLYNLIQMLFEHVTDYPFYDVIPDPEQIIGTPHHRLSDVRSDRGGGVSCLWTQLTKIQYVTDTFVEYSKGSDNVNLMFQSIFIFFGGIISMESTERSFVPPPSYHLHLTRKCCIQLVNEAKVDLKNPCQPEVLPSIPRSSFNWIPKERVVEPQERHLWPDITTKAKANKSTVLASLVSEKSISIIRKEYGKSSGTSDEVGQTPFNVAIKLPPIEFLNYLTVRTFSMFLSFNSSGHTELMDYTASLGKFIADLSSSGFFHLDTLLHQTGILDYLGSLGYDTSLLSDPFLPRAQVGNAFKAWIVNGLNEMLLLTSTMPMVPIYSSPGCAIDQHPILLYCAITIAQLPYESKHTGWKVYKIMKELLVKKRISSSNDQSSINWVREIQRRIRKETGTKELAKDLIKRLKNKSLGLVDADPEAICKECPLIILEAQQSNPLEFKETKWRESLSSFPHHEASISPPFSSKSRKTCDLVVVAETEMLPLTKKSTVIDDHTSWARKTGTLPSSSCYKIASILGADPDIKQINPKNVATVAEGAGGVALLFLAMDSSLTVFYNSLQIPNDGIEQCPVREFIPSLIGKPELKKRIEGLKLLHEGVSNLINPAIVEGICKSTNKTYDIITSDAETVSFKLKEICHYTQNLCVLGISLQTKYLLMKSYLKNLIMLTHQLRILLAYFNKVRFAISPLSNPTNSEVYIICTQPKKRLGVDPMIYFEKEFLMTTIDQTELRDIIRNLVEERDNMMDTFQGGITDAVNRLLSPYFAHSDPIWSAVPLLPLLAFDTTQGWQMGLLRWIANEYDTHATKLRVKSVKTKIVLPIRKVIRWITGILIAVGVYTPWELSEIQRIIESGVLIFYKTLGGKLGHTILNQSVPNDPVNIRSFVIRDLRFHIKTQLIFKIVGRLRAQVAPDLDDTFPLRIEPRNQDHSEREHLQLPVHWWPQSIPLLKVLSTDRGLATVIEDNLRKCDEPTIGRILFGLKSMLYHDKSHN